MIHCHVDSLWQDAIDHVLNQSHFRESRDGDSMETIGWSGRLVDCERTFLINPIRKLSPFYAAAEVIWYLSGQENIECVLAYAPQYKRFAENDIAFGAYGHRWMHDSTFKVWLDRLQGIVPYAVSQLQFVYRLLKDRPQTRQAIISMWNAGDLVNAYHGKKKDIPCTLGLQFLIRKRHLHCVAYMRSNDVWLGLPYDVFAFTSIQRILADLLGLSCGTYTHHVGSLHLYSRNKDAAEKAASECHTKSESHAWLHHSSWGQILKVVDLEASCRKNLQQPDGITDKLGTGTLLRDLFLCATSKWMESEEYIWSPVLRRSVENANR